MIWIYIGMSIMVGGFWALQVSDIGTELKRFNKANIWMSQVDMQKRLKKLDTTNVGRVILIPLFILYNILILPWAIVSFCSVKVHKAMFNSKKNKCD